MKQTSSEPKYNWTKNPNEMLDHLVAKKKINFGIQLVIILQIQRHTWGLESPVLWAKLSIAKLAKACDCSTNTIATALAYLVKHKIVAEKKVGEGRTCAKMYRSTPEHWATAPKYVAPVAEIVAPVAEDEEEDGLEANVEVVKPGEPLILMPGTKARPMPFRLAMKGREPVDMKIRCRNTGTASAAVTFAASPDGLTFTIAPGGEAKANDYSGSRAQSKPAAAPISSAVRDLDDYQAYLDALMLRHWSKAADPDFVLQIVSEAQGAPIEQFGELCEKRLKGKVRESSGILLHIAKDAARAHAKRQQLQQRETAKGAAASGSAAPSYAWPKLGEDDPRWESVKRAIRAQISEEAYQNWFTCTQFEGVSENGTMLVSVGDQATAEILSEEYRAMIMATLERTLDNEVERVQYHVLGTRAMNA